MGNEGKKHYRSRTLVARSFSSIHVSRFQRFVTEINGHAWGVQRTKRFPSDCNRFAQQSWQPIRGCSRTIRALQSVRMLALKLLTLRWLCVSVHSVMQKMCTELSCVFGAKLSGGSVIDHHWRHSRSFIRSIFDYFSSRGRRVPTTTDRCLSRRTTLIMAVVGAIVGQGPTSFSLSHWKGELSNAIAWIPHYKKSTNWKVPFIFLKKCAKPNLFSNAYQ